MYIPVHTWNNTLRNKMQKGMKPKLYKTDAKAEFPIKEIKVEHKPMKSNFYEELKLCTEYKTRTLREI